MVKLEVDGQVVSIYICKYASHNIVHVSWTEENFMNKPLIRLDRFPKGVHKAVVLSFDDGRTQDRRFVDLLNKYKLKGTFHLNSGFFGKEGYITAEEVSKLYTGHEISAHTAHHPFLEQSPLDQITEEILSDRIALEQLAGYPVRGMSYPFGTYNDAVVQILPAVGIEYSRTVASHGGFHMPEDFLRWHPTCHHHHMVATAQQFMASIQRNSRMEMLFIWGHSYEFDHDNNWHLVDEVGEVLQAGEQIWSASMSDIVAYTRAVQGLRFSADRTMVQNPAATDVWLSVDGEAVHVLAGQQLRLR